MPQWANLQQKPVMQMPRTLAAFVAYFPGRVALCCNCDTGKVVASQSLRRFMARKEPH